MPSTGGVTLDRVPPNAAWPVPATGTSIDSGESWLALQRTMEAHKAMANVSARDRDLDNLHPEARTRVKDLLQRLGAENIPFRVFEGYRTPERQGFLYAQGRTRPGPRVTRARPWSSYHQYGVAADFVLFENNRWSWDDTGPRAPWWNRLHELGREVGLKPLSWEKPHLQMANVTLSDLKDGIYPAGGDEPWAENLADHIYGWNGVPQAPPLRELVQDRPAMDDDAAAVDAGEAQGGTLGRYRVTARSGLRIRSGPGLDHEIVGTLPANDLVWAITRHGDWVGVDRGHDGLVDGFCHGAYLALVT